MINNEYTPDVVSPPGETLLEKLKEIGMTQAELANRMGRPKKTINEIIKGKASITPETALQLERVLGIPARFWNNREQLYRQYLTRRAETERLAQSIDWLRNFSIKAMVNLGWVTKFEDDVQQLAELLNFFGVVSPNQYEMIWGKFEVSFRKTTAFESSPFDLSAWLRQGELEAQNIQCTPFSSEKFIEALTRIRNLTTAPPEVFQPEMVQLCAAAGVAVVLVPQLPQARVSGATRWLTPDKALLQLSLRYKTDDHFWFSFFHEAGHILLHGKSKLFLEDDGKDDKKEEEANAFAADVLVPTDSLAEFLAGRPGGRISKIAVREFAERLGIAPGIVVGRLQHDGHLLYTHLNGLKRKFQWTD